MKTLMERTTSADLSGATSTNQVFSIGLAGDSGVGKSRLSRLMRDLLSEDALVTLEGDDYHRWERGDPHWRQFTHLDPRANRLSQWANDVRRALNGQPVRHAHYDHSSGRWTEPRTLAPAPHVLAQGLHALSLPGMIDRYDLKIFIDPDPRLRRSWKITRDRDERGRALSEILESLRARAQDALHHVQPQRDLADWILEPCLATESSQNLEPLVTEEAPRVPSFIRSTLRVDADWSTLATELRRAGSRVDEATPMDARGTVLEIHGNPDASVIAQVASRLFTKKYELMKSARWATGLDGVNQLIFVMLLEKCRSPGRTS